MPWPEASAAGEQRRFIAAWLRGEETVAALCRRFGISRKPGYTRINRFKAWGYAGLGDRSRAPHTHPLATSTEVARRLLAVKRAHPTRARKRWSRGCERRGPRGAGPHRVPRAPSASVLACRGLTHPRRPRPAGCWNGSCASMAGHGRSAPITARRSPAWGWEPDAAGGVVDQAGQHPRADRAGAPRAERPAGAPAPHAQGRDDGTTQAQRRSQQRAFDAPTRLQ